jgi:uncharacterized membrane protein
MTTLSRTIAASIGPVSGFMEKFKGAAIAVGAFATSGPVLAAVAVLGALAAGAVVAGVDFRKLAGIIGKAFTDQRAEQVCVRR